MQGITACLLSLLYKVMMLQIKLCFCDLVQTFLIAKTSFDNRCRLALKKGLALSVRSTVHTKVNQLASWGSEEQHRISNVY